MKKTELEIKKEVQRLEEEMSQFIGRKFQDERVFRRAKIEALNWVLNN